ncbi:MAG: uncharacterized protein V7642_7085 [Burkholderiales bacterium]|jgi:uncharacterized OB-fold protein
MTAMAHDAQTSPEKTFFHALREGRPIVQHCDSCSTKIFPPGVRCRHCHGADYRWTDMNPCGQIYSYSLLPATKERDATNVVLVDLDDGFRMMSTCVGVGPDEIHIGMRVQAAVDNDGAAARIIFRKVIV